MSEATGTSIDAVLEQLRKANGESAARRAKIKELKASLDAVQGELESLKAEKATFADKLSAIERERDDARKTVETAPNEWRAKYEATVAQIKARDHRDAFKALYDDGELKLKKSVPVDKLMNILGYTPEDDTPDPAKIKALIAGARESDPYLFDDPNTPPPDGGTGAGGPAPKPTNPPELPPGPGASRGAADGHASGVLTVTRAQLRDHEWMRSNQAKIADAQKEGRLKFDL